MLFTSKNLLACLFALFLFTGCAGTKVPPPPAAVGSWSWALDTPQGTYTGTFNVVGTAEALTGTWSSEAGSTEMMDLVFSDPALSFKFNSGQYGIMSIVVTLAEDAFKGTLTGDFGDMPISGKREMMEDQK